MIVSGRLEIQVCLKIEAEACQMLQARQSNFVEENEDCPTMTIHDSNVHEDYNHSEK